MEVVGYAYDATIHCTDCTYKYARAVEYRDYVFGEYSNEDISDSPGITNVAKAIELEIIRDSENNPIHAIFDTDESGDTPEHCDDCREMIDVSWTDEAVKYAVNALWDYIHETIAGAHKGDPEVLDKWNDELSYHIGLSQQEELIRELYTTTRKFEE
jgi:hypothetical protein